MDTWICIFYFGLSNAMLFFIVCSVPARAPLWVGSCVLGHALSFSFLAPLILPSATCSRLIVCAAPFLQSAISPVRPWVLLWESGIRTQGQGWQVPVAPGLSGTCYEEAFLKLGTEEPHLY